ncbi:tyrosine-type recombinase/integrase [Salinibaculum rarum]|uniref:tyrosine-type recombinase/integrase n=1 Tax=Salinibaculum rarum TaxID=3058903 RepID=UPI00265D7D03|nr:site-specific integrase [Salinibaculum sp. KK48]
MPPTQNPANPGETPIETALDRYFHSLDAGGSENTLRYVLRDGTESFHSFLAENGITTVEQITTDTCRDWGYELRERTDNDEIAASTAHNYFAYTRAFLEFCKRDGLLTTNPAEPDRTQEYLPEDTGDRDRQFWGERDRKAIIQYVTKRADEALNDDPNTSLEPAYRDRVLVYLLTLTGARGAELFRDPHDEKRNGLRWTDVDFDAGTITVLGKSRSWETIGLTEESRPGYPATQPPLERWYNRVQSPPIDDWPVFPTGHTPSKREALVDALGEAETAGLLEEMTVDEALRETEVAPPAISKNGARSLMKRLCDDAGLDIDGEYLKPHGARRGLGHTLYEQGEIVNAQGLLRHASIRTTHESYSDIQAKQVAENTADAVSGASQPSDTEEE